MAVSFRRDDAIEYLQHTMAGHKAVGLVGQLEFGRWARSHRQVENKYFPGCWVVASRETDFFAYRTCFFVHPIISRPGDVPSIAGKLEGSPGFQRMCSTLNASGLSVVYCFATSETPPRTDSVAWEFYGYSREKLTRLDEKKYFGLWEGRGRKSNPREWREEQEKLVGGLDDSSLTALVLPELFYNGFFKGVYRAGTADPYDTDGFMISYGGRFFPIELKQKSPFQHGTAGEAIGLDSGRILMMLRISLPLNANGFYIVRLVDDSPDRAFRDWKVIRLDEFLMKCSWNVQGGGPGMASSAGGAGSTTSTVIVPLSAFRSLDEDEFSEEYLNEHAEMGRSALKIAREFIEGSRSKYGF
ncbi:MAG: hypothetical protein JRN66_07855 [Nitrososphaerota archaeon]|jgi:hypothetical protein|nr:hypothetical protein [Nitrososphaerota archaeon]